MISVGSPSEPENSTVSPSTDKMPRTCRVGGVTGAALPSASAPGSATSSRRAPSASVVQTILPSAVLAGTPGTMSSQREPESSRSTDVAPVAGSIASSRIRRWSLDCTTISGSPASQSAVTRYGQVAASQCTGTEVPSRPTISSETDAFGVPAAGYRTSAGRRSGFAGSAICQRLTSVSSTRATSSAELSGAHQYPRIRPISSAATNSARPKVMPSAPSGPICSVSSPECRSVIRSAPSQT